MINLIELFDRSLIKLVVSSSRDWASGDRASFTTSRASHDNARTLCRTNVCFLVG